MYFQRKSQHWKISVATLVCQVFKLIQAICTLNQWSSTRKNWIFFSFHTYPSAKIPKSIANYSAHNEPISSSAKSLET